MKKSIAIAAAAVILFGCIFAAGCTTTSDQITGTWYSSGYFDDKYTMTIDTINADGTGTEVTADISEKKYESTFTWKNTGNGTYILTYDDQSTDTLTFNAEYDTFISENFANAITWRLTSTQESVDKAVAYFTEATWSAEGLFYGYEATALVSPKADGTGLAVFSYEDGEVEECPFTWTYAGTTSNQNACFILTFEGGDFCIYSLDMDLGFGTASTDVVYFKND